MIGKKPKFMSSEFYYWDEELQRWMLKKEAPEELWKEFMNFEILLRTKNKSIDETNTIIESIKKEIDFLRKREKVD
jgi:hypothetical protein